MKPQRMAALPDLDLLSGRQCRRVRRSYPVPARATGSLGDQQHDEAYRSHPR